MSTRAGTIRTTRRRLHVVGAPTGDDPDPGNTSSSLSDALPRLASALDEAAEREGWERPPTLVRVTAWPSQPLTDGFDLGVRPLEDELSVVEALAGFTAPAEWLAIGVVTEGNARHLADPAERRRVRCVHLVDRSGASGSTLRLQGEEVTVLTGESDQPSGRIDDVCRRALGLATSPPQNSSAELWASLWLERLLEHRGRTPADMRLPWRDVAELHPAVALVVGDADGERWGPEAARQLTRLGELLAEVHSWPVLRLACAAGEWPVESVPSDVAAWLDDGAFSRWVLGEFPPLDQLAAAACEVVPPSVRRRLRATLRSWHLLAP